MNALGGGGGSSSWWSSQPFKHFHQRSKNNTNNNNHHKASSSSSSSASASSSSSSNNNAGGFRYPLKQAVTAGSLAFAGDSIAQLRHRWLSLKQTPDDSNSDSEFDKDIIQGLLSNHDWLRALRMTSYGFLFYGPGSYVWYQTLDRYLPQPTVTNLMTKVLLNQIILGPAVIAVVFAWNNLWQGKLSELPRKYQNDALSTLFFGFRFWVPYSVLNFWVVPLQARVAFMSTGSIFWNFILSSTVCK